ncbi:MAG: DUF1707 domain-containing protein [Gemmatimonadales bacterium]|nr:DUF1707 domain-containing protein [Gemmatimonadales bacterium]
MTLDLEREEVVQALCAHYAQDHLSTGELESRFERVYRSTDRRELRTVLEGLPAMGPLVPPPAPLYALANTGSGLPADEKRYLSLFSEVKKEGHWVPARRIRLKVIFGSVLLDLREAALPPDGIEIDADVLFGEAKVLLPPGIGAQVDCSAILGTAEDKSRPGVPGAPVIRVTGSALMGGIVVITKLPKPARMESWRKQLKAFFGTGGDDGSGLT